MVRPLIIGFGYKARRGKDTAVQAIIEARSKDWDIRRYGFADALKEEVRGREFELCLRHGIPYEPDNKHRTLLQYWGTDYRRKQDMFYWVKQLAKTIKADNPQIALIADMRFLNEVMWVKACQGSTVKLERAGYFDLNINASHPSEVELDRFRFDYEITVGDGDVAELQRDAVIVFDMILAQANPQIETDFSREAFDTAAQPPK